MYVAIDASTTHLYTEGLQVHIQNALDQGASPGAVLAVLEHVSLQVIGSLRHRAPTLLDTAEE